MPKKSRGADPTLMRVVEAAGASRRGWEAAVTAAVRSVADEAPKPVAVEVDRLWADLEGGRLRTYRAAVKVAYRQRIQPPPAAKAAARRAPRPR